ncbi:hypothetical protein TYRP_014314 [Tyrophagus putrescentiae]|nr:hypothetical protein TYRP_014314 [Tyrophagus putrescentiae]
MFSFDEWLKPKALHYLEEGGNLRQLLDRYWDNLVLYLLTSPLQWLHLMHLLYTSSWEEYGLLSKLLLLVYALGVLAFWEFTRIALYYACRSVQDGTMAETVNAVMGAATEVGLEGYERAGPLVTAVAQSATDLSKRGYERAKPMIDKTLDSASDLGKRGLERAKPMVDAISGSATNLANKVKDTANKAISKVRPQQQGQQQPGAAAVVNAAQSAASGLEDSKTSSLPSGSN